MAQRDGTALMADAGWLHALLDRLNREVALLRDLAEVEPDRLRDRILIWAEEEVRADRLPPKSGNVLEAVLYRGDLPRSEVAGLLGTGSRQARRVTSALIEREVLVSESTRSPLRLAFPAALASRWMPGLFPEKTSSRR